MITAIVPENEEVVQLHIKQIYQFKQTSPTKVFEYYMYIEILKLVYWLIWKLVMDMKYSECSQLHQRFF